MITQKSFAYYYELFGVRGVFAVSAHCLVGTPKEIVVKPDRVKYPVHLRLRTSDVHLFKYVLLTGEYDVELPRPPRTIVDAGANVGMATVYDANKFPEAKIVAVEPEPTNYAALLKNVAPYRNVIAVNAALWDRDCQLHLGPGLDSRYFAKWMDGPQRAQLFVSHQPSQRCRCGASLARQKFFRGLL